MTTQEKISVLEDYADLIDSLEKAENKAFGRGYFKLGNRISSILQALKSLTEVEVILLDTIMNE